MLKLTCITNFSLSASPTILVVSREKLTQNSKMVVPARVIKLRWGVCSYLQVSIS